MIVSATTIAQNENPMMVPSAGDKIVRPWTTFRQLQ
jgi:hypothetical protein